MMKRKIKLFILGVAVNINKSEDCIKMAVERVADEFNETEVEHHSKRFVEIAIIERDALFGTWLKGEH
jgi:hypothetical protein